MILPTVAWSAPEPTPVSPDVQSIPVTGVDRESLRTAPEPDHEVPGDGTLEPAVVTEPIETDQEFGLVGVTFDKEPPPESSVQVRVKEQDGWTKWTELPIDQGHGPDPGDPDYESVRPTTEPLLTNPADEVQVRVDTPNGHEVKGTEIKVVEATQSPADESAVTGRPPIATASAATPQPRIISRSAWGADESLTSTCPGLTDAHRVAFVHHTVSTTNYDATQAPSQLRNILSWTTSNGYCDMPYNFLVDRFGNIYEGRGGGISRPVKSGATASFNNGSLAVSALGDFTTAPSNGFSAMRRSIARLIGWKLGLTGRAADARESLTASGYPGGVPKGEVRTFNRISGHRDAFPTACPGDALYPQLGAIRKTAASYQNFEPATSPDQAATAPAPPARNPVVRKTSRITRWSKPRRYGKRGRYYHSSFRVTPGKNRVVLIKKKRPGRNKKWKRWGKARANRSGYANFRLKFYRGKVQYRLVAPRTRTAKRVRNGRVTLIAKRR